MEDNNVIRFRGNVTKNPIEDFWTGLYAGGLLGTFVCMVGIATFIHYRGEGMDPFITQEEQRLEKELANCREKFTGDIKEGYSFSRKWCDMSLKDGKISQEGYKSCLVNERSLELENCWKDAYQKSNERMKQHMKKNIGRR